MTIERRERLLARRHLMYSFFKAILRLFVRRPRVIDLSFLDAGPAMYLANHSAASGPLKLELFLPRSFVFWGVHEMCGGFRERRDYLYRTFYRQKLKWRKGPALLMAHLFGLVAGMLYSGAAVIPTYPDSRLRRTLELSIQAIGQGKSVLIFPEDSRDGYLEMPGQYFPGFVALARQYRRRNGEDIPICPIFYSARENLIVIGPPYYLGQIEDGLAASSIESVAEYLRQRTNDLYREHMPAFG